MNNKQQVSQIDEEALNNYIGRPANDISFALNLTQSNSKHDCIFFENEIVYILNNNEPIRCLRSSKQLIIFNISKEDVNVMNALLHFIIKKKMSLRPYRAVILEATPSTSLYRDYLTTIFDKNKERMKDIPKYIFNGKVAVKLCGIRVERKTYNVELIIFIHQVKVMEQVEAHCIL